MNRKPISKTFEEDLPITQSDIKSGKLVLRKRGNNRVILSNKQRVSLYLDSTIIEHFKAMAGKRDYQTLINDALKQALLTERIEATIKKTIREELRRH